MNLSSFGTKTEEVTSYAQERMYDNTFKISVKFICAAHTLPKGMHYFTLYHARYAAISIDWTGHVTLQMTVRIRKTLSTWIGLCKSLAERVGYACLSTEFLVLINQIHASKVRAREVRFSIVLETLT